MFTGFGVSHWVRMMPLGSGMPHRVKMSLPRARGCPASGRMGDFGYLYAAPVEDAHLKPWALPHSSPPALTTPNPTPGTPSDADSWWEGAFPAHGDKFPALGAALQPPWPQRGEQPGMRGTGAPKLPTHGHLLNPAPCHNPSTLCAGNGFIHHPLLWHPGGHKLHPEVFLPLSPLPVLLKPPALSPWILFPRFSAHSQPNWLHLPTSCRKLE